MQYNSQRAADIVLTQNTINYYSDKSSDFCEQYQRLTTPDVFGSAINLFPIKPSFVLDIGSGSGRDAAWMANQGHVVTAVEPALNMRNQASELHNHLPIQWIDDRLPDLATVNRPEGGFDFILISAVWMHLTGDDRMTALRRLSQLISNEGTVLISLRHGPSDPARPMLPIDTATEIRNSNVAGFKSAVTVPTSEQDKLGRNNVRWEMLKLSLEGF